MKCKHEWVDLPDEIGPDITRALNNITVGCYRSADTVNQMFRTSLTEKSGKWFNAPDYKKCKNCDKVTRK